jgi:hypothetical protein
MLPIMAFFMAPRPREAAAPTKTCAHAQHMHPNMIDQSMPDATYHMPLQLFDQHSCSSWALVEQVRHRVIMANIWPLPLACMRQLCGCRKAMLFEGPHTHPVQGCLPALLLKCPQ